MQYVNFVSKKIFFSAISIYRYSKSSLSRAASGLQRSARCREMSATQRFVLNWLILLRRPSLGCQGLAQSTSNSGKRIFGRKSIKTIYTLSTLSYVIQDFKKAFRYYFVLRQTTLYFGLFLLLLQPALCMLHRFPSWKNEANHRGIEMLLMQ